jgi:hypothetical protein
MFKMGIDDEEEEADDATAAAAAAVAAAFDGFGNEDDDDDDDDDEAATAAAAAAGTVTWRITRVRIVSFGFRCASTWSHFEIDSEGTARSMDGCSRIAKSRSF